MSFTEEVITNRNGRSLVLVFTVSELESHSQYITYINTLRSFFSSSSSSSFSGDEDENKNGGNNDDNGGDNHDINVDFFTVDGRSFEDIASKYRVETYPTAVILSSEGNPLVNITGGDPSRVISRAKSIDSTKKNASCSGSTKSTICSNDDGKIAGDDAENSLYMNQSWKAISAPEGSEGADPKADPTKESEERCASIIAENDVVLFIKGSPSEPRCGFSRKIMPLINPFLFPEKPAENSSFSGENSKEISQKSGDKTASISGEKVSLRYVDVLADPLARSAIKAVSGWKTFPQFFVAGKLIGGIDAIKELKEKETLKSEIEAAFAERKRNGN